MDEEQSRPDGTELESEDANPNIVDLAAILAETARVSRIVPFQSRLRRAEDRRRANHRY